MTRRLSIRTLVAAVVVGLTMSVAPAMVAHAAGPGSVSVTLTDAGRPVAGASVALVGPEFVYAMTDPAGTAIVADLALGSYTLTASTSDGRQVSAALDLTESAPSWIGTLAFEPPPSGTSTFTGTVVDAATSTPIADALVQVFWTGAPGPWSATTDTAGTFAIAELPAGEYYIQASATGYFDGFATASTTEGSTTILALELVAADARIVGHVVDQDGVGVAGVTVSATSTYGSNFVTSGPDGAYEIDPVGAGSWELRTFPDSVWEGSTVTVEVGAGGSASAPDLVLIPRFTGSVTGLVASADGLPESQTGGGFFDVCVTVLTLDGEPVPGASTVTGGDSFYGFFLAPGEYTLYFEDCDADRSPHGYQPVYLGGSATLAGAESVTVETLVDIHLPVTTLAPDLGDVEPSHDATAASADDLTRPLRGLIDAPAAVRRGATFSIDVGSERAGEWVSAWVYSTPTQIGEWHQVAPDGTITVTMPSGAPLLTHRLSVQDTADQVIGWTWVLVRLASRQ